MTTVTIRSTKEQMPEILNWCAANLDNYSMSKAPVVLTPIEPLPPIDWSAGVITPAIKAQIRKAFIPKFVGIEYNFTFEDDNEAIQFKLRWCN